MLGKLRTIKRHPSHQGHKTIFNGPLHEQHPLIMAAQNGRMDIVNLITDNGTANFWKVKVGSHREDCYLLCRGFYRPEIMKFLIQHNPENFETNKRSDLFQMLSACSLASYDLLFKFLCERHGFSREEWLKRDCQYIADRALDELSEVNFPVMQLCKQLSIPNCERTGSRTLEQKNLLTITERNLNFSCNLSPFQNCCAPKVMKKMERASNTIH